MKNRGLFLLCIIFIFMYILNVFTPLLADDYFSAFVWNEGVRLNGLLPENATRIDSFNDLYVTLKGYYLTWGGRIPGRSMASFFIWQGKTYFNFVNAFMMTFLVAEIYIFYLLSNRQSASKYSYQNPIALVYPKFWEKYYDDIGQRTEKVITLEKN